MLFLGKCVFSFTKNSVNLYIPRSLFLQKRLFMSAVSASSKQSDFGVVISEQDRSNRPNYDIENPLETPSGFTNYTIEEMRVISLWKQTLSNEYQLFGFTPIDLPPVEYACNLQKAGGLEKQIFGVSRLQDGSLTKLGLPFDRTVPLARFIAKNFQKMRFPYSRSDINWSWRGEHAQAGRYRAFIQADVDTVAPSLNALADAQSIAAIVKGLQKLKVPNFNLYVNHVDAARDFLRYAKVSKDQYNDALRIIDKLKPDNEKDVVQELASVIFSSDLLEAKNLLKAMSYQGSLEDFKFPHEPSEEAKKGIDHLLEVQKHLKGMGIDSKMIRFVPNLARGLDYYTGVVFETFMPGREKYGSIASGGRYDNLISAFDPKVKLQGVGGSIGLTRLFDVMKIEKLVDLSHETTAKVFVGCRTEEELKTALSLATGLREKNISVELNLQKPKVGKQLTFADGKGFSIAAIAMNKDEIILKDLRTKKTSDQPTKQDKFTSIEEAVEAIAKKVLGIELNALAHIEAIEEKGE
jgi:histidyl-tRNA synthetase